MANPRFLRAVSAAVVVIALVGCESEASRVVDPGSDPRMTTDTAPQPTQGQGLFARIPAIVRQVEPSVVAVLTDGGQGSGVVWDVAGHIVTNRHVVAEASRIEVAFADGKRSRARLVAVDAVTDLAVLETDRKDLPPATFAERLPAVGELAVAIGNPLGFENT